MGTILVVSSSYLDPLFENAKNYNFKLQAYSDFQSAIRGLSYVNKLDIIGVAIVDDRIYDTEGLKAFLASCDLIGNLNVLFATLREEKCFFSLKVKNTHLEYVPNIEVFTDITINKEVFGTLLLHKYAPYKLKKTLKEGESLQIPRLSYAPLISAQVLNVLSPVDLKHSFNESISTDNLLIAYGKSDEILYALRLLYIKNWYGNDNEEDYVSAKNAIMQVQNDELFCQYMSLLELIHGGDV